MAGATGANGWRHPGPFAAPLLLHDILHRRHVVQIVGKWQVNNLTRDETVALDAMSDHKMQRMLHLVALDNEPADRLMAYVAEEGLRVRPGCVDEFWLSHDRALVSTEDHVLDSDPDDECRLPAYRPRRPRKRAAAEAGVG